MGITVGKFPDPEVVEYVTAVDTIGCQVVKLPGFQNRFNRLKITAIVIAPINEGRKVEEGKIQISQATISGQ